MRPSYSQAFVVLLLILVAEGCAPRSGDQETPASSQADGVSAEQARIDEAAALAAAAPIDPATIGFQQVATLPTGLREPRALAVDALDRISVAGDKMIYRFSPDGKSDIRVTVASEIKCLAVGGKEHRFPGRMYAGAEDHVAVFDDLGRPLCTWASFGDKASLTSIAVADDDVFVADAGNRIVWKCDLTGKVTGRIGEANAARHVPGFFITSHFFDVALGTDGLVYVVNPRLLRIEGYTHQGDLETHWGRGSPAVEDFFGCCNPTHLAVLPDGRFVTAEKGIPRVKVYSREGKFQMVVAGPDQLKTAPADLAVDHGGHILVLDASSASVRIFVPKTEMSGGDK